MKKLSGFFGILSVLFFVAFPGADFLNAQSGENSFPAISEAGNNIQSLPNDVDASLTADLFKLTDNNGNRSFISAIARQNDGKILAAGGFGFVNSVAKNSIVRFNQDGSIDRDFTTPSISSVQKILPLANGKILVAGFFSFSFNDINYNGLVKLNEDGSIDKDFAVSVSGNISDLAVQSDGKIIISGSFSNINGFSIQAVARLNIDGSVDTSFQPGNINGSVNTVAVQPDGKVLIGGSFTQVNNISKLRIARLNVNGSIDADFNPNSGNNAGANGNITEIIVQPNGKILIGGTFTTYNGISRNSGIARLESNGTLDDSFAPARLLSNTNGVRLVLQPDGKILAALNGNLPSTSSITTLYRYNSDGTVDESFRTRVNVAVTALIYDNGKVIIGGAFVNSDNSPKSSLQKLNSDGTIDESFNPIISYAASASTITVQADGKFYVGGNFDFVNQTSRNGLARFNADGSIDETFKVSGNLTNRGFFNLFAVAAAPDGKVLIGGNFTNINGQNVNRLARLNSDGSLDTDFNIGSGPNGTVSAILIKSDGKILVGGSFSEFNATSRPGIVRLNKDGSVDTSFEIAFARNGAFVQTAAIQPDGKILLAGNFTLADGTQKRGIIRLNENGSFDGSFNSLAEDATIRAITIQPDGKILIGGNFFRINGVNRGNIARLNKDGSLDLAFNPISGASGGFNGTTVNAILLQTDGKIWIGGEFLTFNGVRRNRFARLNPDGSLDDFYINPGANGSVLALERQLDGRLLVGGSFTTFGRFQKVGLARISLPRNSSAPLYDFDADGKTDLAVYRPQSGEWRIKNSGGNTDGRLFGLPTDIIVPGDYDGDRKTDLAVFRPSSGIWFILRSSTGVVSFPQFGTNGDIPLAADYDGDGRDDLAVFRPSNGTWYILQSGGGSRITQFGANGDVPVIGDFDGDCKADIAVFRPSNGVWYILRSRDGFQAVQFGIVEDVPVSGDYDGDGKTDLAVFRPSNGIWYILGTTRGFTAVKFGLGSDRPVPGDYDGDSKTDIAVFRPSTATWFIMNSSNNSIRSEVFGATGDTPIPSAFLR